MKHTKKGNALIFTALKLMFNVFVMPVVFMEVGDYFLHGILYVLVIYSLILLWVYFFGKKLVAKMVELRKEIDEGS